MDDEKPSYHSIITADVRYDERLKPNEKLLYSEITALSNKYGYCTATNSYFSKLYRADKSTVSRWVSHLEKCGYVQVEQTRNGKRIVQRKIYPIATPLLTKKSIPYAQKDQYPIDKKVKGNITRVNTTSMNMRERIKQPLDTNSKFSLLSWPDSLGAMTDQISKLLQDGSQPNGKARPESSQNERQSNFGNNRNQSAGYRQQAPQAQNSGFNSQASFNAAMPTNGQAQQPQEPNADELPF